MARNRVIYQSQALFIAPSSTGIQVSGTTGTDVGIPLSPTISNPNNTGELASGISLLKKMDRIQSCNFNFTINRQDINEFGKLARIDSIVMETPTVGLDFSYYATDGYNERLMGFNVTGFKADGSTFIDTNIANGAQSISGLLSDLQGNNYYILTVDEGEDVVGGTLTPSSTIVGIGNGFISEYSFEASVGAIPTVNVTVEAFNIKSDASETPITLTSSALGTADANIVTITGNSPAVDLFANPASKLTNVKNAYKLDYSRDFTNNATAIGSAAGVNFTGFTTGSSLVSALRPGDIVLTLPSSEGLTNLSTAHIQSFSFTLPLSRTVLQRLGNTFGFARVIDVPINMDLSLSAIVSELRDENLFDILASPTKQNFTIALKDSAGNRKIAYTIKGAILQSETYSENLGDNQTVDLTYTVQIGGANDTTAGLFMSGSYASSLDSITSGFFKLGTGKLG
jgi:hypothetical protein